MKIKASTVLSIISFVGVVVTGILAAKGGKEAQKIEDEMEQHALDYVDKKDIRKATWKCYIPAVASGIITLGCGAYAKRLDTKEILKLTGAVGLLTSKLERVVGDFAAYRDATTEMVGAEKEAEIRAKAAEGLVKDSLSGMEEKKYKWMIDWVNGKPIFFEATPMQVEHALTEINRKLARMRDDTLTINEPTVSDFFYEIGHPELANNDTDTACWDVDECCELHSWWVDFEKIAYGRQDFTDDEVEYFKIEATPYPNGFPYNAMINAERAGTL